MKIDTSKIDGYAEMSAEDKLKALEGLDIPDPDYTGYVKKDLFDKKASELAQAKKELEEKLSDDEKSKLEQEKAQKELEEKYNQLLHESQVAKDKAQLVALGYDEKLADETAEAMVSGDTAKVFENQKKFKEALEKSIRAEALKDTPKPEGGAGSNVVTLEDLRKMSPADRLAYSQEHPDEYKELYKGGET